MPGEQTDADLDESNKCFLCCKRLCTDRFDKKYLRSLSGAKAEKDIIIIDKLTAVRGKWSRRIEFLLSCIGFAVGLGNVWRFPIRVYESGGGAFLLPYTILCFGLGVPILLLEMGIGQFSGRGPTKVFKLVPIIYGLGWAMIVASIFIEIYYAVVIAWSYFYLFGSFTKNMPWTVCTHKFNSPNCLESGTVIFNTSEVYVSSTSEYWDYYVTGFIKYPDRVPYVMNENPGSPQWHLALCLLLTWIIAGLVLMFGVKISGKVIYFSVLYPYFALFCLFCLGCTLPGAANGVRFYLKPDWSKIYNPTILRGAVEQLFYSSGLAMGGMITYSSYNDFRDNFYRDALIVIFIDFFTSLLAGFAIFPILGYIAHRTGLPINKVVTSGASLFFITFTEALATLPAPQFWTILLMIMAITLGMDSQFALFETVSTGIMDLYPVLYQRNSQKAIVIWVMCFMYFLAGLLLVTPGGTYWFDILDRRVTSFGLPLIALLELIFVVFVYGFKQLRYDYRMMMGFSLCWYWFIMMAFVCPIIIFMVLIASLISFERIKVAGNFIPTWGEVIAFLCLIVLILPIVTGIIHTMVSYRKKYPDLKGKQYFKKLIDPPVYWGPFYKKNWLLSEFYREKLLKYKDDPLFLKYVAEFEKLNSIVTAAQTGKTDF